MRSDSTARKRSHAMRIFFGILEVDGLSEWTHESLSRFWRHVDCQSCSKVNTKRGYMMAARAVKKKTDCSPSEWTEKNIIRILEEFGRKRDRTVYAAQYRNQIRAVTPRFLVCFEGDKLHNLCKMLWKHNTYCKSSKWICAEIESIEKRWRASQKIRELPDVLFSLQSAFAARLIRMFSCLLMGVRHE